MIDTQKEQRQGFLNERLTQTATELQDVREKLKSMNDRIGEADTILRFYSDPRNYKSQRFTDNSVHQCVLVNDFSESHNDSKTNVAGKRAREYLIKHGLQ